MKTVTTASVSLRGLVLAALIVSVLAVWISSHLALRFLSEFRLNQARTPGEIRAACRLDPGNDLCAASLAARLEEYGMDARSEWNNAIRLNPRRATTVTQAAVAAEVTGDLAGAEQLLLEAERYNKLWLPRWSLASFYYRHGRREEFLHWTKLALERAYMDRLALFRLARDAGASTEYLLTQIIPNQQDALANFVYFLSSEGPIDALEQATRRYLDAPGSHSQEQMATTAVYAVNNYVRVGGALPALKIWNLLCSRKLLPYPEWSAGNPLTNTQFRTPLPSGGFDWRIAPVEGVEILPGVPEGGVKLSFSGRQPENTELLSQVLYLSGGRTWRLSFESRTRDIPSAQSGLGWRLTTLDGQTIEASLPANPLSSEDWTPGGVGWRLAAGDRLYVLRFEVRRLTGQTRIEGSAWLRNLQLSSAAIPEAMVR